LTGYRQIRNHRKHINSPCTSKELSVRDLPQNCSHLPVRPWPDPIVEHVGYDARSNYVERFWLGILGPSATWFLRYIADQFDVEACALTIGLGHPWGANGAFSRTLRRCAKFSLLRLRRGPVLEVRRRIAPLTQRQIGRLPDALREEHARWVDDSPTNAELAALRERARRLALSLLELGEDATVTEQQLLTWRFPPTLAAEATRWATDRTAHRVSRP
jgi:hypothetical protein